MGIYRIYGILLRDGDFGHEPSEASSAEPITLIDTNILIFTKKMVKVKVKVNVDLGSALQQC